ncbi:Mechanosensitive ion channel protein 5 [Dendrobium catenatum]|uniref:Mechanosensitive ion channel protein 5 n=2 Tax=Dendrobium catenatum TaxID=906689 RepID=A0A2I0XB07_9ASPA|nr:Mechanosensitive ion channel protein 5 [Dendrobium catenatum]
MKTRILIPVVGSKVWKESSNEFQKEVNPNNGRNDVWGSGGEDSDFSFQSQSPQEINQDPPSRPIRLFMKKQKKSGAEMTLDMNLEMEGLKKPMEDVRQSKELRIAYQDDSDKAPSPLSLSESEEYDSDKAPSPLSLSESEEYDSDTYDEGRELWRGSATARPAVRDASAKVLKCSSNSLFCRKSNMLLRDKTRSRKIDSLTTNGGGDDERKSLWMPNRFDQLPSWSSQFPLRSSPPKSRPLSKSLMIEDPFEELPDEFNHTKMCKWTILQLIGFILLIVALIGSLTIYRIQHQTIWGLHLWKLLVLVLVLKYGFLLSCWLTRIINLFLERNFKLYKRLLYFVYSVRNAVHNCIWLGLVLIVWQSLFDKKILRENKALSYITRILFCLIVAIVLRLMKTLTLKVLAFSFHVSTYFDRIQEAFFKQYVIQTLTGPPLIEIQHKMEEDDRMIAEVQNFQNVGATIPNDHWAAAIPSKTRRVISGSSGIYSGSTGLRCSQIGKSIKLSGDLLRTKFGRKQLQHEDGITMDQLHKLNQKTISAWNMKRLMRIVRHGTLTIIDEQITRESGEDESTLQIRSEHEANIAAKKIFNNVAKQGAKHIYLVDVMRFMREDEALRTMALFNGARDYNRVSRRTLKNWVV